MAKQNITAPSYAVNNVQQLADIVQGDASALKTTFDKTGSDTKDYIANTLITELNGSNGANKIGLSNANLGSNNVADGIEEVRQVAVQAQSGTIVDNSITNAKLAVDVKVGSLASLATTDKSNVVSAINESYSLAEDAKQESESAYTLATTIDTNLSVLKIAKTSTGSSVAYALDTSGTFDLNVNGNRIMFIPNVTNTGSCTISIDGQTAKPIRKSYGNGSYIDLDAGDIKQGVPTELVWSAFDFFILRPSAGGNIKSIQRLAVSIGIGVGTVNRSITQVDLSKSVIRNVGVNPSGVNSTAQSLVKLSFTSDQNVELKRLSTSTYSAIVYFDVIEFNNVKSIQTLNFLFSATTTNKAITAINTSKSEVFHTFASTVGASSAMIMASRITTSTNVEFLHASSDEVDVCAFVVEFN